MTHPNLQTNGASLEDCHTNFFALTELSGIKWRKLVWSDGSVGGGGGGGLQHMHGGGGGGNSNSSICTVEPQDDPVLRSYSRCLAADILCVWRRVSAPHPPTSVFDMAPPPPPAQPPPLSLASAKELWIFWYGEEPDLGELVAPELLTPVSESEQGSWESGLSYECRSLLFKALHNLIERCLLSRDFMRLGKWFVQPYEAPKKATETSPTHLSFSFAFFVHGESSVCASVDVRQHPPVRRLSRAHLQQAHASSTGLQVILAPFGLAGTLTGHTCKPVDAGVHRLLEDWSQFYPVDSRNLAESSVVEVIVGGVKMRYPGHYVLVTDMDDNVNGAVMSGGGGGNGGGGNGVSEEGGCCGVVGGGGGGLSAGGGGILTPGEGSGGCDEVVMKSEGGVTTPVNIQTPPPSPIPIASKVPQPGPFPVSVEHPSSMQRVATIATVLPERVWQECMMGGPPCSVTSATMAPQQPLGSGNNSTSGGGGGGGGIPATPPHDGMGGGGGMSTTPGSGNWDFLDPTKRANCTCSKCRKYNNGGKDGGALPLNGKHTPRGTHAATRGGASCVSSRIPFHRRNCTILPPLSSVVVVRSGASDATVAAAATSTVTDTTTTTPSSGSGERCSSGSYTPVHGGPPSYPPRTQESVAVPSVGSPPSAAPSPLPNPPSQPTSVPPHDQTMPTLSPQQQQPPSVTPATTTTTTSSTAVASALTTTTSVGQQSPLLLQQLHSQQSNQGGSNQATPDNRPATGASSAVNSPMGAECCKEAVGQSVGGGQQQQQVVVVLKRPTLSSTEYETVLGEEEHPLDMLYDYSTMDAWLNHPVKRFKPDGKENFRNMSKNTDLYALFTPNGATNTGDLANSLKNGGAIAAVAAQQLQQQQLSTVPFIKQEIKQEPGCQMMDMDTDDVSSPSQVPGQGVKRPGDPYEFEEEGNNVDGFKRGANGPKEEPKKTGNLFTSEGLQPSYKDLDQIFDNSDTSSDEATQIQTPPGSNKSSGGHHDGTDGKRLSGGGSSSSGGGSGTHCGSGGGQNMFRAEELSKMFPTPPSLEHNPVASPCGNNDPPISELNELGLVRIKQDVYPNMGSPQEENIEDWSYVFKPPPTCKLVGSSKYAPLTNLPSQNLPPVTLPTNCVYKPSWMQHTAPTTSQPVDKSQPAGNGNGNNTTSATTTTTTSSTTAPNNSSSGMTSVGNSGLQQQMQQQQQQHQHSMSLMNSVYPPSPSPLHGGGGGGLGTNFRPPPPPYEMPSPATSTTSSYHNKNVNSVEAANTPGGANGGGNTNPSSHHHHHRNNPNTPSPPEVNGLLVNVLLADTLLNIFRDHNFDSCTMCVCNAMAREVGNIRGADASIYLSNTTSSSYNNSHSHLQQQHGGVNHNSGMPDSPFGGGGGGAPPPYGGGGGGMGSPSGQGVGGGGEEDTNRCSCGFSAVVNRRLSHRSGLFYEDEMQITGIAEDPGERKKCSLLSYLLRTSPNSPSTNTGMGGGGGNGNSNSLTPNPTVTPKLEPGTGGSGGTTPNPQDREQLDTIPHSILELLREQCVMIQSTANSLHRSTSRPPHHISTTGASTPPYANTVNVLEYTDGNEVTGQALEHGRQVELMISGGASTTSIKLEDPLMMLKETGSNNGALVVKRGCHPVHRWPFLRASGPQCNQDIVRVMKCLQPLLQEAIQKKCQARLWEAPSAVKGPLTWRQFHRLAGRGTVDRCEPQPIPSVIVGHEKDWLSLSPYALQHWESLLLEPYSYNRDIAYVVVAPENEAILPRVRTFFKELSTAYEMCRLGRHAPITKVLRDGILRVGKAAKQKLGNEPVEEWFTLLGEGEMTDMLKLYAQVCKHHLAPHLQQVPMDKSLLDPPNEPADKPAPSPMLPPPSTPESSQGLSDKAPSTPKSDDSDMKDLPGGTSSSSLPGGATTEASQEEEDSESPAVVVYLVDPFTMSSDQPEMQRLAYLALLRCFQSLLAALPENIRTNISVQIISQESIVELGRARDRLRHSDHMRALALSIFSQCRRLLVHTNNVKSLTGFGTAAMADLFLKSKDEKNRLPYKLYTPPYVLAPLKEKAESAESFGQTNADQASVLYLSYCLSEDQSWLLAVATDEKGEIFETVTVNVDIPNRARRKKASARRIGLQKLMDFILGVMSQSVRPWRLVVGRVGRIGHGELKGWSWLLSRKHLLKASKHLKELCSQCSLLCSPGAVPSILSACLVSLEPDSALRLMPDQFTPDERFSQFSVNSQLATPQDLTCTHILVFPTSATTQSSQSAFHEAHINEPDLGDDELFNALNDDMPEGIDEMNDLSDIFNWTDVQGGVQSPTGSPRREESRTGSPTCGMNQSGRPGSPSGGYGSGVPGGHHHHMHGGNPNHPHSGLHNSNSSNANSGNSSGHHGHHHGGHPMHGRGMEQMLPEEVGTLLQQPLALGYCVSTAPTGRMPRWFWAACPHLEDVCPAFLKHALHMHSPNVQQSSDDLLLQQAAVTSHPLDSQYTTDVLRYVLEGYNALSWLALDSNTRDRLSCLPVHVQVLTQLYHTTATLL